MYVRSLSSRRAWIEILTYLREVYRPNRSLSSRRAWIEIMLLQSTNLLSQRRSPHGERGLKFEQAFELKTVLTVALLTESVDWNTTCCYQYVSPSIVALLTESVDWNIKKCWQMTKKGGRSPHGERGLKSAMCLDDWCLSTVALLTESVDWNWIFTRNIVGF